MYRQITIFTALILFGLPICIGCSKQSEPSSSDDTQMETAEAAHDGNDVPLTEEQKQTLRQAIKDYEDALTKIKSYRDTIRDAVAAGTPTKAHSPLDELDVVLEHLTSVARDSQVPRTQWETVNTSAQQLRNSFNKIHAQIDADEQPNYEAVSDDINAAIDRLEQVSTDI